MRLSNSVQIAGFVLTALVLMLVIPMLVEPFALIDLTLYMSLSILALSLAFVWGFGGILSLGQAVFFGIGGYAYAIAALNMGDTTLPFVIGLVLPMLFALALGYFMFWGRISDVYLAVITLTVSLIFFLIVNSMSGLGNKIGSVAIGGYNGIPGIPPLNVPFNPASMLSFEAMYYVTAVFALLSYALLRWVLTTRFGKVLVATKENEMRAELLGYDSRKFKLAAYVIGAGLAGLSGLLYAIWGGLINPDVFGMAFSAQVIVWVLFGGLGTLVGPVVGAILIQMLVFWLGKVKLADANIVLGALFILFVLLIPAGILPMLRSTLGRFRKGGA